MLTESSKTMVSEIAVVCSAYSREEPNLRVKISGRHGIRVQQFVLW